MDENTGAPVVVGVDGSAAALDAVRAAAREAVIRHRPLRIVHAFVWPLLAVPLGPSPFGPAEGGLRHQAERIVAEAVEAATLGEPGLAVTGAVVDGEAAAVLLGEGRHAVLLVLGHRGLGGFAGLLLGSVGQQVAEYTDCPVLVVRGAPEPHGPVLVGVDGSELSAGAVDVAVEEAVLRGAKLVAAHAWSQPVPTGPGDMAPLVYDPALLAAEEERVLAEALSGQAERQPDLPVRRLLAHGRPADVLIDESAHAQLVVVGARGRGGFTGLLLGSVSQALLRHAHCPVLIVPRH